MKRIIINPDNIEDKNINQRVIIYNLLFINSKNELILDFHHNSYYFIHEYLEDDILNKYKIDINRVEPFLIKMKYILDYPLIGNSILYESRYYLIKNDMDIDNGASIPLSDIETVINDNKYNNPKNVLIMEEILEVVNIMKEELYNE